MTNIPIEVQEVIANELKKYSDTEFIKQGLEASLKLVALEAIIVSNKQFVKTLRQLQENL